jgi:AcrR family transcriptional regulator
MPDSTPPRPRPTRRTEGLRTRGRSARVVAEVLKATLDEIGRVGYEALRFEDVAALSGVNKTTIYRRWPTKVELVSAALRELVAEPDQAETGSLETDLVALLRSTAARAQSNMGRGILKMLQIERTHPEVDAVKRQLRAEHMQARRAIVERAIQRGELPPGTDAELVVELVFAPVLRRVVDGPLPADDSFIEATVAVVLAGARGGAARPRPPRTRGLA